MSPKNLSDNKPSRILAHGLLVRAVLGCFRSVFIVKSNP